MCLYVGVEVVLANLLSANDSASLQDIVLYCQRLSDVFFDDLHVKSVYMNINNREIEQALSRYEREFRHFQGRFYINEQIDLHHFNARFDDDVAAALTGVAQALTR